MALCIKDTIFRKKKYLKSKKHCSIQISGIEKKEGKTKCKNDQKSVRESNVGRKVEEEREANFKDLLQVCKNEL